MDPSTPAAAWHPDPAGRFAQRYWNGTAWTEHVIDATGARAIDHLPAVLTGTGEAGALTRVTRAPVARVEPLALIGAAAVLAGSLLPWFTYQGASASAWGTPLLFLLAGTGAEDQMKFGPFLLVTVLVALPYATGRPLAQRAALALAAIPSVAGGIAVAQALAGADGPSIGAGVVVTLAGGSLLCMAAAPAVTK